MSKSKILEALSAMTEIQQELRRGVYLNNSIVPGPLLDKSHNVVQSLRCALEHYERSYVFSVPWFIVGSMVEKYGRDWDIQIITDLKVDGMSKEEIKNHFRNHIDIITTREEALDLICGDDERLREEEEARLDLVFTAIDRTQRLAVIYGDKLYPVKVEDFIEFPKRLRLR